MPLAAMDTANALILSPVLPTLIAFALAAPTISNMIALLIVFSQVNACQADKTFALRSLKIITLLPVVLITCATAMQALMEQPLPLTLALALFLLLSLGLITLPIAISQDNVLQIMFVLLSLWTPILSIVELTANAIVMRDSVVLPVFPAYVAVMALCLGIILNPQPRLFVLQIESCE